MKGLISTVGRGRYPGRSGSSIVGKMCSSFSYTSVSRVVFIFSSSTDKPWQRTGHVVDLLQAKDRS